MGYKDEMVLVKLPSQRGIAAFSFDIFPDVVCQQKITTFRNSKGITVAYLMEKTYTSRL